VFGLEKYRNRTFSCQTPTADPDAPQVTREVLYKFEGTDLFVSRHSPLPPRIAAFLDFGMKLTIDDFGSGYSSFRHLALLPESYPKIDKELITLARAESRAESIVRRIQHTAETLGQTTVAECIEDEETAYMLEALGADGVRGLFLAVPSPHDAGAHTDQASSGLDTHRDRSRRDRTPDPKYGELTIRNNATHAIQSHGVCFEAGAYCFCDINFG
jgi:hypothetical protein